MRRKRRENVYNDGKDSHKEVRNIVREVLKQYDPESDDGDIQLPQIKMRRKPPIDTDSHKSTKKWQRGPDKREIE